MTTVHLGFALGAGEPVAVPIRHMAVTGQTQESGKTTTLEALVARSGVTALAFVTKRGETSFAGGHRVQPYFRDRADWQFVTSIIDATLQEKNKFLRPWIMRICRTTRSLADVQREVRIALKKAKGINEGVYTQLDAYLDLIVPVIQRAKLAPTLELRRGLNVMDVSSFATPMQMLFVQSALDWVNERETSTIVVIPEAWEFIPEGKGSPVKASAEALVRKGAGIGNYIWVDSQDMAGVDKVVLRGCPVWIIGVQREANEIKRTLANIPAGIKKPSAADVATLQRGQFYACWSTHAVKTYVQPSWMESDEARLIARGEANMPAARWVPPRTPPTTPSEATVTEQEARELQLENAELRRQIVELQRRLETVFLSPAAPSPVIAFEERDAASGELRDEGMDDRLYRLFRKRLLEEEPAALLRVLASRPELEIQVQREMIAIDGKSLRGRLALLISEGFFEESAKTTKDAFEELAKRGGKDAMPGVSNELVALTSMGFLRRDNKWYRGVPEMKVNVVQA